MTLGPTLRRLSGDLGYEPSYVARRLGTTAERLEAMEAGAVEPDANELAIFAELFGVSEQSLWVGEIRGDEGEMLRLLFRARPDMAPLAPRTRAAIARAAGIARQYTELGRLLGLRDAYQELRQQYRHEGDYSLSGPPWVRGEELALHLRANLGLGDNPLRSVRHLAVEQLGAFIVTSDLRSSDIAACSFSSPETGPTIVTNVGGKNSRPWRWRFTVAHELCHLLFDELAQTALGAVTRYADQDEQVSDAVEQRANSFSITLLAPKQAVRNLLLQYGRRSLGEELRHIMTTFGINFKAARYRARHTDWATEAELSRVEGVDTSEPHEWRHAEPDWLDVYYPCPSVPMDRRGQFSRRVMQAYTSGVISRGHAISLLEAAPDDDLDQLAQLVRETEQ